MRILGAVVAGLMLLLPQAATAQDFPAKPIKLIVPFPAGGPNDIIARIVGQRMSELTKQPIVIDNRGGQGGALGTDAVAKANPDGYTIGIVNAGALAINQSMEKVPYETLRDLAPVTLVVTVPEMLVVASNVPAKNMGELVALAKAKPGALNFASTGPGSLPHLAGELLKLTAGIDIVHVPYRGAAPATNDLIAGTVDSTLLDITASLPHIRSGSVKALAVSSDTRSPVLPDVPTLRELGLPKVNSDNWYALISPGESPLAARQKIHDVAVATLRSKEVVDAYAAVGGVVVGSTSEELATFLRAESAKWAEVIQLANVKLE